MQPLSLQAKVAVQKYLAQDRSLGANRQPLQDGDAIEKSLADQMDVQLPKLDNTQYDHLNQVKGTVGLARVDREDLSIYEGNSREGKLTQQVTFAAGQAYTYAEMTPQAVDALQVLPDKAVAVHIDRQNPANSYREVQDGPWKLFDRPDHAPDAPDMQGVKLTQTPSGLEYAVLHEGTGPAAASGHAALVDYTGWLENGQSFDSSLNRGQPFQFVPGTGQVIRGWDEGVAGMKVGETRLLHIPSNLAYGDRPVGPIPANSTLNFEVTLLATE